MFDSRIARLLFFWNFVALAILAGGALLLAEMRAQLIRAKADSLLTQGELIASALADTATKGEPEPALQDRNAREVLRRLMVPESTRVRLFLPGGELVADTDLLSDRVIQAPLPPLARDRGERPEPGAGGAVDRFLKSLFPYSVLPWRPNFTLDEELKRAAAGERPSGQRKGDQGERVVSVSIPVQHVQAVVAVLTLESGDVEAILQAERRAMAPFILAAAVIWFMSSTLLALLIAEPLQTLATVADRLRLGQATRLEAPPVLLERNDEIGDLARSLKRMVEALLDRIDANERFAADVSHEIKNPLTSIRSAVETARAVQDPAAREKLLAIIAADVGRVDRLITDIARASRIESETARGAPAPIDLSRMLPQIVETYEAVRREGEVAVHFVGPAPPQCIVIGQEAPLGQVLRNLIDNAKSFSPEEGDVTVYVREEIRRDGRWLRIHVDDAGPGVPEDNLETIFQRFYTERPKGKAFGTNSGLGLAIVRQIIDAHKGRVWAENIPGDRPGRPLGARFIVELPAAPLMAAG
ncbi:MAG: stimulus-sensing domain-containing protein [Hyphomonadaceae bacterium]|nr:stimulus-sensing domain-containing protein [Hyphomonadaceae bacterium]